MTELLPVALKYLSKGYSVIPVGLDKRPLATWKEFQTRRATVEELVAWWTQNPDSQIGIVTGQISNLTVIDVESDGDFNLIKDQTFTVKTGGGGRHYYFQYEKDFKNAVRIFPSVDVRSEGGYVVASGSRTSKGSYETLIDLPANKMSDITREAFKNAKKPELPWFASSGPTAYPRVSTDGLDYNGSVEGGRNDAMTKFAGSIHAKLHPSLWATIGWQIFESANQKNNPPLSAYEIRVIWNSIGSTEARNNPGGRDYSYGQSKETTWGPAPEQKEVAHQFEDSLSDDEEVDPALDPKETLHASEVAAAQVIDSDHTYPLDMLPFDNALLGGFSAGELVVVAGQSGHGKCLARGTPVLMWNGIIKKVEDIKAGEKLMGPDSKPRKILSICRGKEMLYDVIPTKGEKYTVNESHILSLRQRNVWNHGKKVIKNRVVNISINDYLKLSKTTRKNLYGYHSTKIYWNKNKKLNVDPYFLGLWLGDGNSRDSRVTTTDEEIKEYLKKYAKSINHKYEERMQLNNKSIICSIRRETKKGTRKGGLQNNLRLLNLLENKHIPLIYKTSNIKNRMHLLAGLIDSDGYLNKPGSLNFVNKSFSLANDVAFLVRSLGFFASIKKIKRSIKSLGFSGDYYLVSISGDLSKIPLKLKRKQPSARKQIKDILISQIKVKAVGVGEYFGFQIDGDKLFMLGDFTVTHNTTLIQDWSVTLSSGGVSKREKLPTLWFSYEVLAKPLWQKFQGMGADADTPIYMPRFNETGETEWVIDVIERAIKKWGIKIVCIDHLGFLRPPKGNYSNAADAITNTVRILKKLAVKRGLIILLPVHVRKTSAKTPDLNDIRDSLGIAQEADTVFFIGREKDGSGLSTQQAKLWLVKNRKTGIAVSATFDFQFGRYYYNAGESESKPEE